MTHPRSRPKILIVDDKPQNLYALEKLLTRLEVEVIPATSGLEALSLALEHDFCLAVVDVQMPEMDGYELVELLRGNPSTAALPIIFVSAIFSDEYHHRKGYETGAVDFLSKPFVPEILLSKAQIFLDLYHQRVKLETVVNQLNVKNKVLEHEIQQRQQVEAALHKANSDKDKLFSIISHDLRGPFQPVLGNAELLKEQIELFSLNDIQAMAGDMHKSARAIFNLLDQLLTWSLLQQGRMSYSPEPLELCPLAENTVNLLAEVARSKQIRLAQRIEAGLMVQADSYMVETVIRNLTSNALKFTPAGGQVTISAQRQGVSWVEVKVLDTGVGMSQADIEKLFQLDVHHTTPGTAQEAGTGLGLILCQEMVVKNGGQIWVESQQNKGTTVTFTLPALASLHPENGQLVMGALKPAPVTSDGTGMI